MQGDSLACIVSDQRVKIDDLIVDLRDSAHVYWFFITGEDFMPCLEGRAKDPFCVVCYNVHPSLGKCMIEKEMQWHVSSGSEAE